MAFYDEEVQLSFFLKIVTAAIHKILPRRHLIAQMDAAADPFAGGAGARTIFCARAAAAFLPPRFGIDAGWYGIGRRLGARS